MAARGESSGALVSATLRKPTLSKSLYPSRPPRVFFNTISLFAIGGRGNFGDDPVSAERKWPEYGYDGSAEINELETMIADLDEEIGMHESFADDLRKERDGIAEQIRLIKEGD